MILAFDTFYKTNSAKTVCIAFNDWQSEAAATTYAETINGVAAYEPGAFYKRELPCILSLLKAIELSNIEAVIVDGFVVLDDNDKPGLGHYLFEKLEQKIPVIGVAKTNFATLEKNKRALFRGQSERPLYITSAGIDIDAAANNIKKMYGKFRMPDLLKKLDGLTREE